MAYETLEPSTLGNVFKLGGTNKTTGKPFPKTIEGYYLGSRDVVTSAGAATIHDFKTARGVEGIWGSKDLNTELPRIPVGTMTLVEYKGKESIGNGKTKHTYLIKFDKLQTTDVADAAEGYADTDEDVVETYEEVPVAAVQSAKERAQALLNSKLKNK